MEKKLPESTGKSVAGPLRRWGFQPAAQREAVGFSRQSLDVGLVDDLGVPIGSMYGMLTFGVYWW